MTDQSAKGAAILRLSGMTDTPTPSERLRALAEENEMAVFGTTSAPPSARSGRMGTMGDGTRWFCSNCGMEVEGPICEGDECDNCGDDDFMRCSDA